MIPMAEAQHTKPEPLPMSVISGYLGAGKTTFINTLLQDPKGKRITVLVNDFGSVSLDEKLISNQDGDIIALANGCMCCQIGGDLYRTIDQILQKRALIDLLIVETSGVADPAKIANIAAAEPDLALAGTLTLIDCLNFCELLQNTALEDTLLRQVKGADLLLLTKTDLANVEQIANARTIIHQTSANAEIFDCGDKVLPHILTVSQSLAPKYKTKNPLAFDTHKVPFESWSWQGKKKLSKARLMDLLKDPVLGVFRFKGTLLFDDGTTETINKVGEQIDTAPCADVLTESVVTAIGTSSTFNKNEFAKAWKSRLLG